MLLILLLTIPVFADDFSGSVIVKNKRAVNTSLSVTKEVTPAVEGYEPKDSDTSFSFTLKLDGEGAAEQRYRLFNRAGQEIYHTVLGVRTSWKTDRNGDFTLKDGETARFEDLDPGEKYQVVENDPPKDYQLYSPIGGDSGVIPKNGKTVKFVNEYNPTDETKETTDFVIKKSLLYPEGLQVPQDSKFTFQVKLDGKDYAGKSYAVLDSSTGEKVEEGKTDENGRLQIAAGQEAKFKEVPVDSEYEVSEMDLPEGFHQVSAVNESGSTHAPLTEADFVNRYAAFAVSKEMEDGSEPDHEFEFELTDSMHRYLSGVKYTVYGTNGEEVKEGASDLRTSSKGRFTLKAGQTAVFRGVAIGTSVNIMEIADQDYTQTLPADASGYTDEVIGKNFVTYPFVNKKNPQNKSRLTVIKRVQTAEGVQLPSADDIFTFRLEKKDGDEWKAVSDAVYSVRRENGEENHSTKTDGTFRLKYNEAAVFEGLEKNCEYRITEPGLPSGYRLIEGESVLSGTLKENGSLDLNALNEYSVKQSIVLKLHKENLAGNALEGAEFALYTSSAMTEASCVGTAVTDDEGNLRFDDLSTGVYWLKEIKAPEGYRLPKNPICLTLMRDAEGVHVKETDSGEDVPEISDEPEVTASGSTAVISASLKDSRLFELPMTGGRSMVILTVIALLIGAVVAHRIFLLKKEGTK